MKITKHLLSLGVLATLFTACKDTEFKKTKDGFPYKVFGDGKGDKIQAGDFIAYHRTDKIGDSVLESSYGNPPQFLPIPKDSAMAGNPLAELLVGITEGDSVQINQPVDSIIRRNPQAAQDPFLAGKKGQSIVTIFKIMEVYKSEADAIAAFEKQNIEAFNKQPGISDQRKKDEATIEQYLKSNNIQAQRTPWGAYVQVLQPGTGPKPKYGQFAMIRYTGKTLNGVVFDATSRHGGEPLPVQIGAGRSIPGFEDGVKQLSEGAKANIYVPSVVGYGTQGTAMNQQTNQQDIKPNESLIFEVEVLDITDQRPAPSAPQIPDSTRR